MERRSRWVGVMVAAVLAVLLAPVPGPSAWAQTPPDHVQAFGGAPALGSLNTLQDAGTSVADAAVVALVPTLSGNGYWIVTSDGSVYSFGDAAFLGSIPGLRASGLAIDPNVVIVAAVRTPSGSGYWLVDGAGGVFGFGDAGFFGSIPALKTAGASLGSADVVAAAATPSGNGYWLVDGAGGVFGFGDAGFLGSIPSLRAAGIRLGGVRIIAMGGSPSGNGYWLADEVGGVFTFGDAGFFGSAAGDRLGEPVVGFAATAAGDGYRILTADGRVRSYGNAPDAGSATIDVSQSALALASTPTGTGYWVVGGHTRPASAPPLPPGSGTGRRIVYSNSRQRVWLVERSGVVSASWSVSGRRGVPSPGVYRVFSKSLVSTAHNGSLLLRHMVRFAHGDTLAIGFHAIPTTRNGRPIQGLDELGQYRSAGCVRQAPADAQHLYNWAPLGTTVVVTP